MDEGKSVDASQYECAIEPEPNGTSPPLRQQSKIPVRNVLDTLHAALGTGDRAALGHALAALEEHATAVSDLLAFSGTASVHELHAHVASQQRMLAGQAPGAPRAPGLGTVHARAETCASCAKAQAALASERAQCRRVREEVGALRALLAREEQRGAVLTADVEHARRELAASRLDDTLRAQIEALSSSLNAERAKATRLERLVADLRKELEKQTLGAPCDVAPLPNRSPVDQSEAAIITHPKSEPMQLTLNGDTQSDNQSSRISVSDALRRECGRLAVENARLRADAPVNAQRMEYARNVVLRMLRMHPDERPVLDSVLRGVFGIGDVEFTLG